MRHLFAAAALVAISFATALAHACDGMAIAEGAALRPFVLSKQADVRIAVAGGGPETAKFVFEANGRRLGIVEFTRTDDHVDARFRFEAPLEGARFGVEATVKAQSAELFDVKRTVLRPNGKDSVTTFYPYDWGRKITRSVRHADSVIPGFKAGGLNIVYDTPKLGAINIRREPGCVRAVFPYYREVNDAGDRALVRHVLRPGMTADMRIYAHAGLAHIQDRRFATPDRKGMAGAHIAQMPPRAWTPNPDVVDRAALWADPESKHCAAKTPGAGRYCFPTDAEVQAFAEAMPRENGIAILRFALPLKRLAAATKAGGAIPYYYLFFGAIGARDGDPSFKRDGLVLTDSAGKPHMAPYPIESRGNWFLLDLTRPAARQYFIDRALEALDNGYEGVFMDGGFLWNMPNGIVGGVNPDAEMSQYQGRVLLMRELRAAMRAKNPTARLGILASPYAEYMHYADWVLREGTAMHWKAVRAPQHLRAVQFDPKRKVLKAWQSQYGRLAMPPVFYACKGPNPVLLRTCRQNLGLKAAGFYYDSGDWNIHDAEAAAAMARLSYGPGDLYVTRVEGDRKIQGVGASGIRVEDRAARVWFSRAAPVLRVANGTPFRNVSHVNALAGGEDYVVADREGPGRWSWAHGGFVHRDARTFVAGDFHILETPTEPEPGGFRAIVSPTLRVEVEPDTPLSRGAKPGDDDMLFEFVLPQGAAWRLETLDGRPVEAVSEKKGGRETVLVAGHARLALTLTGLTP